MDFLLTDTVPHPSGSPVDGGVRTARVTTAHSSSAGRRSFSAVLHGARGEERRAETREADDGLATNKSDRNPRSKETKGLNLSSTQNQRTEASPAQAQASDKNRSGDDENRVAEDSKKARESTDEPNNASADSQGPAPAPLLSPAAHEVLVQANGQTNVRMKGEDHLSKGDQVSERKAEADESSSTSSLILSRAANPPMQPSNSAGNHSPPGNERSSQHDSATHASDAPVIPARSDPHAAPVVKPEPHMVVDDAGTEIMNHAAVRSVPLDSQPGSTVPQPEAMVSRAAHVQLLAGLVDGKPEIHKTDSVVRDGAQADRAAPTQMNWYGQSLSDDQDAGMRTGWVLPQGQQSTFAAGEHFNSLWADQNGLQPDHTDSKLPQAAAVDPQVANGQSTGTVVAGVHSQSVPSPMTPPPTAPFVNHTQPAMPGHDPTDKSAQVMARSVVFDVAQPDLGHVNIRVAMTNDVVHTHLSADRPEVGQFLINGQDRLQAAFQANGLDMGQFRVDIDRQNAGRSFQQGQFQEQGQAWNQDSHGMEHEHGHRDRQDEPRVSLHGLLNLVA